MPKFMLSVNPLVIDKLKREAEERGVTIQEVVRAVIIPFYFRETGKDRPIEKPVEKAPWAR